MKIAITGHKHGIGKALTTVLTDRGHEIIGISRSDGENIRRTVHTTNLIVPCDMFINNAQTAFAQTELLYSVWEKWQTQKKYIWNISTAMTEEPVNSPPVHPGTATDIELNAYRVQKLALEEASKQLRYKSDWPKISIIRPGKVETNENNKGGFNVDEWAKALIDIYLIHPNIHITELSLGDTQSPLKI